MTIPSIEQEIITQLLPIREEFGVVVSALPQEPSKWASVAGNGWVSVQWSRSELQGYSLGEQSSEEWIEYSLDIRIKKLRGTGSLYQVLNRVKELLWGFQPTFCYRPITVNGFEFIGMAEDYWVAQGRFTAYVLAGYSQQYIDYTADDFPVVSRIEVGSVSVPCGEEE
jgi:hypothetical protein